MEKKNILKFKKALFLLGLAISTVYLTSCEKQNESQGMKEAAFEDYDYKIRVDENHKDSFLEKVENDSNVMFYELLGKYDYYDEATSGKVYVYGIKYIVNPYENNMDETESLEKLNKVYKKI